MTGVYVVVAAMVFLFLGMMLCAAGFFAWYMLRMIRELKASVDLQVKATHELLGEGSFTRISKSLSALNGSMPDILSGMKEFSGVMRMVFKAQQEPPDTGELGGGVRQPRPNKPVDDGESAFYPGLTDQEAAVNEVAAEAKRQGFTVPPEIMEKMVTDTET